MKYIVDIQNAIEDVSVDSLGGKGCSLVKLSRGGFPVPEGFIITTQGYNVFADSISLKEKYSDISERDTFTLEDAEMISDEIYEIFSKSVFPEEYKEDLLFYIEKMKNNSLFDINLLAIRSSATTEDLGDASFAGMHDTLLNVSINKEDIEKAVLQCWSSLYTPRAILYRYEKRFPIIDTSIAVVVQRMVPSEKSGVIFSSDPQTSSREHISLDGVIGLGEALVSGMVSTDHWSIRKHYPVSYKKTELRIVERTINHQLFALYTKKEGGTEKKELKEEEGKKACFNDNEIYTISQYAVDIENYYKKPMDMEFCVYKDHFYIVQARPITTLIELPEDLDPLSPSYKPAFHCYVSYNHIQMITNPIDYMTFSINNHCERDSAMYTRYIAGYIYTDRAPMFCEYLCRWTIINAYKYHFETEVGNAMEEWYKSDFYYNRHTVHFFPFLKGMCSLAFPFLYTVAYYYYLFYNPDTIMKTIQNKYDSMINLFNSYIEKQQKDINSISLKEIYDIPYYSTYIYTELAPFMTISVLCRQKIHNIFIKNSIDLQLEEKIYGGRRSNLAVIMDSLVSELYTIIQKCEIEKQGFIDSLKSLFYENTNDEDEIELKKYIFSLKDSSISVYKQFYIVYTKFMNMFGRRGPGEISIINKRYIDQPSILLKTVLNASYEGLEHKSPDALEQESNQLVDDICGQLSLSDASTLRYYLEPARITYIYREHPKYCTISHYYLYRQKILQIGKQMVEKNIISSISDIFHLSIEELLDIENHSLNILSLLPILSKRKSLYNHAFTNPPPRLIISSYSALISVSEKTKRELLNLPENILKGMPTSAGIVEGKAVVVLDPKESHLQKGDILVAPATDPGWTPLFVPASAVVIAIGGPLTHGSIVAREMGIPCVVNVNNLMEKVKTGMRIRVDGSKGTIEILDENKN
ncbi:hypothetical protein WA158_002568 [Blastocystis sp. Blastoise]